MRRPPRYTSIVDRAKVAKIPPERALQSVAMNGLLARLSLTGADDWIVKGAQALIARRTTTRATNDLDLRIRDANIARSLETLRHALTLPRGDGLAYREHHAPTQLVASGTGGDPGVRIFLEASLDGSRLTPFHIDLVAGGPMRGETRPAEFSLPIEHADFPPVRFATYPAIDHIADKLCALAETHGPANAASSRVKDLYDVCVMRREPGLASRELGEAITMQWLARNLPGDAAVSIPPSMRGGYEQLAKEQPDPLAPLSFDDAIAAVRVFLEQALDPAAPPRIWNGETLTWE